MIREEGQDIAGLTQEWVDDLYVKIKNAKDTHGELITLKAITRTIKFLQQVTEL